MIRLVGTLALVSLLGPVFGFAGDNKACGLITAAELQSVLGSSVALRGASMPGDVQMCTGSTPQARVLLRLARRKTAPGTEAKGIEIAKKMGAQVDVKTFGPITCSTFIPPKNLEEHGFNTTCTVTKADTVAGVEITAKSRAGMVPIEKLHPLAEKMSGRF